MVRHRVVIDLILGFNSAEQVSSRSRGNIPNRSHFLSGRRSDGLRGRKSVALLHYIICIDVSFRGPRLVGIRALTSFPSYPSALLTISAFHACGVCVCVRVCCFSNEGEFDDMVIAPVFGFDDSRDYYDKSQAGQFLEGVRVPLLVVQVILLLASYSRLASLQQP